MLDLLKRNKNFRILWLSSCISGIGDYFDDIAFAMLIYMVTNSTLITSYVFGIKMILSFISMFTSTFVDNSNKKNILIVTSLGQSIVLFIMSFLYMNAMISTCILIIFVTVQTIFSTFSTPAKNSILPIITIKDEMIDARASFGIFQQFLKVFSYICSGFLINTIGILGAFIIDAISFAVSALVIILLDYKEIEHQKKDDYNFFADAKDGFIIIFSNKIVMAVLFVTFLGNLFTAPVDSLSVAFFSQDSSLIYSAFMAAVAFGSIIGTWLLTKVKKYMTMNKLMSVGFLYGAIGLMLLFTAQNNIVMGMISGLLYGLSTGFVSIMNGVMLQKNTPKEYMGRVFSAFACVSYASSPVGTIFAGYLGEKIELNIIFFVMGICLFMTALLTLYITDVKEDKEMCSMKN